MAGRITIKAFQEFLCVEPDGDFGSISRSALFKKFSNTNAPAIGESDIALLAGKWDVSPAVVKAIRVVEAPRGAFDNQGRPTILYEKHVFGKETGYKFNSSNPDLSSSRWQPGTYGAASRQWDRLAAACALDPESAFRSCSWGAFQVMGYHAEGLDYQSVFQMALELRESELNHLDCFGRFIKSNNLMDELRQCRGGDANSCIPFVRKYNGAGFRRNNYHVNLANAIRRFS